MKLKLDADGHAVLQDGQPVYVHDDGREIAFDAAKAFAKIGELTGENTKTRKRAETAEANLKQFEGIEDAAAARKAMETVANFDQKKLVDAGEVDKVKAEAIRAVEEKYAPTVKRAEELERELYGERIGGSFSRSKFIAEKAAIPPDFVQARFGSNFKMEDGKVVAYDNQGNKIFSRTRPGEVADFDEALETLVNSHPNRDAILKGTGATGMGSGSGVPGGAQHKKFSDLNESERTSLYKESPERYQQLKQQG
jgi:hypothetical protein